MIIPSVIEQSAHNSPDLLGLPWFTTWPEMRFYYAKKESYTGRWLNSMRHGYGKFTYHDGAVYEGRWEADLRHGQAAGGKPT